MLARQSSIVRLRSASAACDGFGGHERVINELTWQELNQITRVAKHNRQRPSALG